MRTRSIVLAMSAVAAAMPASAAKKLEATVRVQYKDLDLATSDGRDELERRLDNVARGVCGIDEVRTGTRLPSRDARRCLLDVRASLDRQFAALIGDLPQG